MRARLIVLIVLLGGGMLVALSVPYAQHLAASRQQAMFLDRLQDTVRFASAYQQLGGDVDQALREDLVRYNSVYSSVSAAILDRKGTPRAEAGDGLDLDHPLVRERVRLALNGHETVETPTVWPWEDRPMVVAVPVLRSNDVIGVALTVSSTQTLRRNLAWDLEKLAIAELAALILLVALASRLASWMLKPVYVLDGAAHQISSGDLSTRVGADHGPVELRRLAISFNGMAHAVESALERERAFVADASHQLRNPLSALTLRLEALGIGLDPERREELEFVYEEASRLATIVDELLELTHSQHVRAEPVQVEVAALVAGRLDAWRPLAQQHLVRLGDPSDIAATVVIDPALVSSALDAVLDNAIKFSPAGGRVDVEITEETSGPDSGMLRIDVTDEGPGLSPEDLARIGDRFWRSASSQNVPGSGLGLSIARTLLDATGGRLGFGALDGYGLRVSVWLPRSRPGVTGDDREPGGAPPGGAARRAGERSPA